MYGGGYLLTKSFAGKSSLKPEDARPDYESLEPAERKVLDQWYDFFQKVS